MSRIVETDTDNNFVKLELSHNSDVLEISTGGEFTELTTEQAESLHKHLGDVLQELKGYTPPAPRTVVLDGEKVRCYDRGGEIIADVGGMEICREEAETLIEWLQKCLNYHSEGA